MSRKIKSNTEFLPSKFYDVVIYFFVEKLMNNVKERLKHDEFSITAYHLNLACFYGEFLL